MGSYHHHRNKRNKGSGIPDRWLNYNPVGRDIEGTRFVPFKTPLDERFFRGNSQLTEDDYFDVRSLISKARVVEKKIGLVIDLTNTDRYYEKSEWKDYDIEYFKINCPGHEVNTREDIVKIFVDKVDDYFSRFPDDSLVGVHCTHGLNRTGYLICRYLIDKMNWTPADAISKFEYYRGHPIERGQYKRSLFDAYYRKIGAENPNEINNIQKGEGENKTEDIVEVVNAVKEKEKVIKLWTGGPPEEYTSNVKDAPLPTKKPESTSFEK